MDVRFVNPFITATQHALRTMANLEAERGTPFLKGSFQASADVSGVIGLAGQAKGAVALSFPWSLARSFYEKITGEELSEGDPAICDAVGELANVVVGGAKAGVSELGLHFQISVPTVISGKNHVIANRSDTACLIIPFHVEGETFWLQVAIKTS
ncbi:MAG: chemotaxis protein CheX [Deltaproteobacteria bacterium]|nr:chemotaxis protein CheX [Deltaproteobacteria bacterium]